MTQLRQYLLCGGLGLLMSASMAAQDTTAKLLQEVFTAHGVTPALLQAEILMQGKYSTSEQGQARDYPLLIKTRGYQDIRFEVHAPKDAVVTGQFGGFRWNQKGLQKAQDIDGRYSLNLPFMDSPSAGLLAYLLDNLQRIEYREGSQGTLDGVSIVRLVLRVPDADASRRRMGFNYDRQYELVVDAASKRLLAASVVPLDTRYIDMDLYRFEDYVIKSGVLFAQRITRSSRPIGGSFSEQPGGVLLLNNIVFNQHFSDDDFKRPAN